MTRGKALEPMVVRFWCEDLGQEILDYPMSMFRHPEHRFMLATPDAKVTPGDLLEIKTVGERQIDHWRGAQGTDDVPVDVLAQAQQQCAVMGLAVCHVAVWLATDTLLSFRVDRNEEFIEMLVAAERELWERIRNADPPLGQHQYNLDAVKQLYRNVDKGREVNLSFPASQAWTRRQEIKALVKELVAEQEILDAQVLVEMGDAESAVLVGGEAAVKRIKVHKAEHTVKGSSYTFPREVKYKGEGGLKRLLPAELLSRHGKVKAVLIFLGYLTHKTSESGSRYYIHKDGRRVRVSDHAPNTKTLEWMREVGCDSIRVDDPEVDLKVEEVQELVKGD